MPKNLVVFSDGTGQEGGKGPDTNIYKLFNMIEDRTSNQIAFYDRGLGTGWRKLTGNGAGMGISKNIIECYEFLFENYSAGDKVYLFGFSRGATTVRSLSSFIHLFGILPKSRKDLIKKAYKVYKIENIEKRKEEAAKFVKKHHTMWCEIEFLGVWDTVAALGVPFYKLDKYVNKIPFFKHKFHDLFLSTSVRNAYQALSIDDERLTFHPELWDPLIDPSRQKMKQVWFCGMHTDVGGGYKEQALSDIPLEWMINMAMQYGLMIYNDHKIKINPKADGLMHDSRGGKLTRFFRKKERSWNAKTHGNPSIHQSVLDRTLNRNNKAEPKYDPWILSNDSKYEVEPW